MKCKLEGIEIKAITTYLPKNIIEMDSFIPIYGEKVVKQTIVGSGIERIHIADDNQTSLDMCYEAAEHLLKYENYDRSNIDGLVMISQTFDYLGPASSIILQDKLGLSKETVCFDIIYGCSGYIYGIYQASLMISSGSCKNVLLLNGETNSRLMDYGEKDQAMVFGDCASATLITKGNGQLCFNIFSDGRRHQSVVNLINGFRTPILQKANMIPKKGNGELPVAINDGMSVFDFIIHEGSNVIKSTLEYMNWEKDEVDFYALHQATKVTLHFLRKRLKLDFEKSPFNLQNYGNTSSTTIPLVITSYTHDKKVDTSKWSKVIMAGYGIGLSWGSVACDLSKTSIYKPICY